MKSKHFSILLLTAAIGCTQSGAPPAEVDISVDATAPGINLPAATATLIRFTCPGMTWGGCRATVNSTLQSLPGVANIEINAADTSATVSVDPTKFKVEDAMAALLKSGFPADTAEDLSAEADPTDTLDTVEIEEPQVDEPAGDATEKPAAEPAEDASDEAAKDAATE